MIIISGLSGAGKTVALHTLEDIGYYCIDNLPISLLPALYNERQNIDLPIAVGIDIRSNPNNIDDISQLIIRLKEKENHIKILFLSANSEVLVTRFSESRRKHPLTNEERTPLIDAINKEKEVLSPLLTAADSIIDTSKLNIYQLKDRIHHWSNISNKSKPTITIESFGFKNGPPIDADLMFDVRFLPNPYWDKSIRHLNGCDSEIGVFLLRYPETKEFIIDTSNYLSNWLDFYLKSHRSYLTIAIGCTGGKHRSVFISESIKKVLSKTYPIYIRHRDL